MVRTSVTLPTRHRYSLTQLPIISQPGTRDRESPRTPPSGVPEIGGADYSAGPLLQKLYNLWAATNGEES